MGDIHNLFGDTDAIDVRLADDNRRRTVSALKQTLEKGTNLASK